MSHTFSDTRPSYLGCKHWDITHAVQDPHTHDVLLCVCGLVLIFQYCQPFQLHLLALEISLSSSPLFSSLSPPSTYWSGFMTVLQAREAPQPVRYEDSRLAGVRRLEAGSGRFPGMCVFPHSGAITVRAALLLFLSPFCLYRSSLFWLCGAQRRAYLGSSIMAGTHYTKRLCPCQGLS